VETAAAAPGCDPKAVMSSAAGNQLTIKGERTRDTKGEGKEYFSEERSL
jgi:HSP20 family molecular chaperone IbpA